MNYTVKIDNFEGPLDLLLYFIQKDKLDIYDISVSHITKRYLDYIELMQNLNIEIAGEFIYMAALLMKIKSRSLLPRINNVDDNLIEDPRIDLINRLSEYKEFKEISLQIEILKNEHQKKYIRGIECKLIEENLDSKEYLKNYNVYDLISAFSYAMKNIKLSNNYNTHIEKYQIQDKIKQIKKILLKKNKLLFKELIKDVKEKIEMVVIFLALLDIVQNKKCTILQNEPFNDLYIEKC